ncbi:hypothetical protein CDCA_CDCA03G0942 [Cyanidium caldarium]|uniref:Uncharacterized protein n=1 Tax=Cyanidium caldarium TaxID=2771 RepID=A0AAV9IRJ1_CYACA|nr:hypothetical protein CDCA_CDCA03G0942 [Cyanidium caldarium]
MRIVSITVLRKLATDAEPVLLAAQYELSGFNFFQRGSVRDFAVFFSKLLASRTPPGERLSVDHEEYACYVYSRSSGLSAVAICDREYPQRVAFTLLGKVLEEFRMAFPEDEWRASAVGALTEHFRFLSEAIHKYQNPAEADTITRIERDLDETKAILHQTIDNVLERGVKLDQLVDKSNDLSLQSKMFYKTAKQQNSCCNWG